MSLETEPTIDNGEPLPALRPHQRHQQMEADAFCESCGYNLHGQPVNRDERLGLMVCRCPECGRYHAAGKAATGASVWLSRVAAGLMGFWILIILFAVFWIGMGFGAIQVMHVETLSFNHEVADVDGREVEWTMPAAPNSASIMVYKGTTQPAAGWHNERTLVPPNPGVFHGNWSLGFVLGMALGDAALGFVTGALLVTLFWHWKRRRYPLVMLLPFLVAAFALYGTIFDSSNEYASIAGWTASRILMHAAGQAAAIALGVLLGRPLARGLVRMFIPPKPRQHLAFLWQADGRPVPPVRTAVAAGGAA